MASEVNQADEIWDHIGDLGGWNFDGLEGSDDIEPDWWSSSNAHTREPALHYDVLSSPSIENFSGDLPPRHPARSSPSASRLRPRDRAASPESTADRASYSINNHSALHHRRRRSPTTDPRRRAPVAHNSDDLLDAEPTRAPSRFTIPDDLFGSVNFTSDNPRSPSYGSGIDIDDFLQHDSGDDNMPATRGTRANRRGDSIVDLTDTPSAPTSSTPRHPISLKRSAAEASTQPPASKRRRIKPEDDVASERKDPIEELDLTNEAPSAEEELAQTQQHQLLQTQRSESSGAPLKMGKRTCIICLDNITNATVTSCGHMFCHECLTQAIRAAEKSSEKGVGGCPVCRKPVKRNKEKQMIPIAFMKRSTFKGKGRRIGGVLG
ncbi:uncharacterized protein LTR77_007492 [Saxophila tyrrhenica]|uniref:RING-type domain-containing protein n=1 Tax=Saxophila tyrrhenica TaxID=1690608 RepID=A0AAV9P5K8_9PEZI|nr:hypothetical protein LTR77_007492 [Saxophila tyrrhenica]